MFVASSFASNPDVDATVGETADAAAGLIAFAFGFAGQGCGVCAAGLALDVWAAMASAAVGLLPFGGALDVRAAMASAAVGVLPFGGALDV